MTIIRPILYLAAAFALVCLGLAALQVRDTLAVLPGTVNREATLTRELIDRQMKAAQHTLSWQINEARTNADGHVRALRTDLIGEVRAGRTDALMAIDQVSGRALGAIGDVRVDLSGQLVTANETLARETARLNSSMAVVAELAPPLTATAKRFQEVVEIGTDCEASPRCWQNTLYDVNTASQQSSKAFTDLTVQTAGIATDVHAFTTEFTRKRTWKEKLWSGFKAAGGIAALAVR